MTGRDTPDGTLLCSSANRESWRSRISCSSLRCLDALGCLEAGFSIPQIYWLILEKNRAFIDSWREWTDYRYVVCNQ